MHTKKGTSGLLIIIILSIVILTLFYFYGDKYEKTKKIHDAIFTNKKLSTEALMPKVTNNNVIPPPENVKEWCKLQDIKTGDDREALMTDKIIGWDNIQGCCVREITGFNCALGKNSTLKYCYTSNVGGRISYVTVDDYYASIEYYRQFIDDYDKEYIVNKPCDRSVYPLMMG